MALSDVAGGAYALEKLWPQDLATGRVQLAAVLAVYLSPAGSALVAWRHD